METLGDSAGRNVRVGVDIGGTFTDIIAYDSHRNSIHIEKVPSTPDDPSGGVIDGLENLFERTDVGREDIAVLSHGSTVTLNALIEHTGARMGLLVTEGFSALPLARSGDKPEAEVKNPRYRPPKPLVPYERVGEIPERVGAEGDVVEALDEAAARRTIESLAKGGVESIAVCLLFSFLNPSHERRLAELIEDVHPSCSTSLSSDVAPRIREFPRLSTTTINAYIDPILGGYLTALQEKLTAIDVEPGTLSMMLSHGGLTSFSGATRRPVETVLSGPAAGVQGALFSAEGTDAEHIVTMDMGGTSCDVAIAPGREPVTSTDKDVGGHPISVPMVDIEAIGAGGGTIALVENGRLRVGPESAGAAPGPACYGRGGDRATVTDANLVLGRLGGDVELADDLRLDEGAAVRAIEANVANPLGLSVEEAAAGVLTLVNNMMKKELSLKLTKQGYDPRTFTLVVFGGAGPMHAPAIARELSLERVVIPRHPGINSAVGLLTTDQRRLYERSRVDQLEMAPIDRVFADLAEEATAELRELGADPGGIRFDREVELRYAGQTYELDVPVSAGDSPETLRRRFDDRHEGTFGHVSGQPVETMTYRVVATVETAKLTHESFAPADERGSTFGEDGPPVRDVFFDGEFRETPVFRRVDLGADAAVPGPAIVTQQDTTIVVEPGMTARVDGSNNLVISIAGGSR